ncbi:MAG TPA: DUF6279 family lipoprotein [Nitrospira sp.]|nr:DUF6279 family lipoprotein [Nitrospira sp.]
MIRLKQLLSLLKMKLRPLPFRFNVLQLLAATAFVCLAFVTGCAMTFGYRHADWLIRWQLDHYLDLNSGQRREVTSRLQTVLKRHRNEALPQYEQFLKDLQQRIARGLTTEDINWIYASYDRFRADLFERVAPDGGLLLTMMTNKQTQYFGEVALKEEQKAERRLQKPLSTRLDERAKTMLSLAEDWLGPLNAEQASRIRQWSVALPDTQVAWWQYRHHRHQELLSLMQHPSSPSEAAAALRMMFVTPEKTAPKTYVDTVKDLRAGLATLLLGTDHMLTPTQRSKAVATLQKLIDDVHSLRFG